MRVFSQKDKLSISNVLFLLLMNLTFNFYLKAYDRFFFLFRWYILTKHSIAK